MGVGRGQNMDDIRNCAREQLVKIDERRVCAIREAGEPVNAEVVIHLNRLSDVLWLLARWVETKAGVDGK